MRIRHFFLIPVLAIAVTCGACRLQQTQEGQLPEYEQTREGQLPRFEVEPLDVDVTTDTQVVAVPRIQVGGRDTLPRDTPRRP